MSTTVRTSDGTSLVVHVSGDADRQAVVQLSGGPGYVNYLADVAWQDPAFVLSPETRGVGGSGGGPHDVRRALADLEDIRESLHLDSWVVLGHSWGADLGLAYTLTWPTSVEALVYACGTGVQNDRDWSRAYHDRQDDDISPAGDPFPYDYSADVHASLLASWRRWIKRPTLWREITCCDVPVDFVLGGADIRPSWPVEQMASAMSNARLTTVDGAHHDLWAAGGDVWRDAVQRRCLSRPRSTTGMS